MALSPPDRLSSVTMAATRPAVSSTTAYCDPSASPGTDRGSMRVVPPTVSVTVWVVTSDPSAKRYQRSVALVAVADWMTIGVVQPRSGGPDVSDRVTFGMKSLPVG